MVIRGEIDVVCGGWQVNLVAPRDDMSGWADWFNWIDGVSKDSKEIRYLGSIKDGNDAVAFEFFFRDLEHATQFLLTFG